MVVGSLVLGCGEGARFGRGALALRAVSRRRARVEASFGLRVAAASLRSVAAR